MLHWVIIAILIEVPAISPVPTLLCWKLDRHAISVDSSPVPTALHWTARRKRKYPRLLDTKPKANIDAVIQHIRQVNSGRQATTYSITSPPFLHPFTATATAGRTAIPRIATLHCTATPFSWTARSCLAQLHRSGTYEPLLRTLAQHLTHQRRGHNTTDDNTAHNTTS